MRHRTRLNESDEEKAARCLAHGIAHACAGFGKQRLATILGTIALELAESLEAQAPANSPTQSHGFQGTHSSTVVARGAM
jgi:hypothetical protein